MRLIDEIAVHTTATPFGKTYSREWYEKLHKSLGWKDIGYHEIIKRDGSVIPGRPTSEVGAHVQGHNANSLGISYEGGLGPDGKPADTRTPAQKATMERRISAWLDEFPKITRIQGHRDYSPDKNRNGKVDPWERIKECPCFDAIPEYEHLLKARGRIK